MPIATALLAPVAWLVEFLVATAIVTLVLCRMGECLLIRYKHLALCPRDRARDVESRDMRERSKAVPVDVHQPEAKATAA